LKIYHLATLLLTFDSAGLRHCVQGCQMAFYQTKNPTLGKFWRVLQWKMLVYYLAIWSLYGSLVYFVFMWYTFSHFGVLYRENLATLIVCTVKAFNFSTEEKKMTKKVIFKIAKTHRSKFVSFSSGGVLARVTR
jgi:hypothetical protein